MYPLVFLTSPYATGEDEGIIFEEDEEANEGYLFAGQGTYAKYNRKCTYIRAFGKY